MIDTKLLRQKLIDMAMRGLLVEQRPEDGNAIDLLEQIRAEKAALIKAGKIKKEKPLPEIEEEEKPFAIPDNWCWVRLGEIFKLINGDRGKNYPAKSSLNTEGIPFISAVNLDGRTVVKDEKLLCVSEEQYNKLGSGKLRCGDIVLCIRGSLGKHGRYPFDIGAIASSLVILRNMSSDEEISTRYLMNYLDASLFYSEIDKYDNGTAQPNLAADSVKKLLVPLPPLAEQKRIVAALEASLKLVDTIAKDSVDLDKALKFLRQKVLDMAMRGLLVEQRSEDGNASDLLEQICVEKAALIKKGQIKKEKPLPEIKEEEKPFTIPDSWCWVRLGEIGIFKKGPFGSSLTKSMFVPKSDNAIKVYEQKNAIQKNSTLGSYYITKDYFESNMQGFEVFPGDIIVSCAGTIGETYLMPENMEKGIINQALMRIKLVPSVYLGYFLTYFDSVLKSSAQKESRGSALKNIPPFDVLKKMLVPLPPLAEQKRIVAKLEQINALIDTMLN